MAKGESWRGLYGAAYYLARCFSSKKDMEASNDVVLEKLRMIRESIVSIESVRKACKRGNNDRLTPSQIAVIDKYKHLDCEGLKKVAIAEVDRRLNEMGKGK